MSEILDRPPQPPSPEQIRERARAQWLGVALVHTNPVQPEEVQSWQQQRACNEEDPDIFFAETDSKNTRIALSICRVCVVRAECLEEALAKDISHGVWGGLTERERRKIKRRSI